MNLLRSLVFHWYFSDCGMFQRFTLSTFSMKLLRSFVLSSIFSHFFFFQKSIFFFFSREFFWCLVFHWYFLIAECFRGSHLVHFRWNSWGVSTFIDISHFWFFLIFFFVFFDFFSDCGIFQRSTLSTFTMKLLRSLVFHRIFSKSVEFFWDTHLVHLRWNSWKVRYFHRDFLNVDFFKNPY